MSKNFTPPFPKPQEHKLGLLQRFRYGIDDWIKVLYKKSYNLKLGDSQLPSCKMFTVGDPQLVDEIFKNKNNQFEKHDAINDLLEPLLGQSVLNTKGEQWEEIRYMMREAFTFAHLPRCFDTMSESADELIDHLKQAEGLVSIDHYLTHAAADIIIRTMISEKLAPELSEYMFKSFLEYQEHVQKNFVYSLYRLPRWRHKRKALQQAENIRQFFVPVVEKRYLELQSMSAEKKAQHEPRDFLDALILARSQEGKAFSIEGLLDQISMLYLAGHETSATGLSWGVYLLSLSSEWQTILYEEIMVSLSKEPLSVKSIKSLKKLNYFFKETLRLYPPIGFLIRRSKSPIARRGKKIRPKDILTISPWLIQRSENHWKNPHEFEPNRFDVSDESAQQRCPVHDQATEQGYLPFGKGKRRCIGEAFAMQEAMIVLAKIIINFEILPTEHVPEAESRVTTRAADGIKIRLQQRENIEDV